MANPVVGYDGIVTIGATPVTVNKVRTYTHQGDRDETEKGPWIGDANKVSTVGGKIGTLDLEGDVVVGGDPGVEAIKVAFETGTTPTIAVTTEDGYTITYAAGAAYLGFGIAGDAAEGQTWTANIKGAYTITQDT